MKPSIVHLWFPNIFEFKGGIQVYSQFLLNSLQHLYPQIEYEVFLKHDTQVLENFPVAAHTHFHCSGFWPELLRSPVFAAQLLGHGFLKSPNLVIASHLNFTLAAYWLKHLRGVPYWTVAHGVDAWNIERPVLRHALRHADRILAVSRYTRDRLLKEQNLDPQKISLLPNTFEASHFHIAPKPQYLLDRYGLTADMAIVLTVTRLSKMDGYKGYDQIIKALSKICQYVPNVHYLLVGKGDDQPRIQKLIHDLNLQNNVTLTGFVADNELCDHYNLCDVFAMPSKGEGFGIVYLEALACGKPTLGGNQDGAIDALCQGELGALVDPDDVGEIAQTLIRILQGIYPKSILYQPEMLRQKVIEIYGFDRFQETVAELMHTSPVGVE